LGLEGWVFLFFARLGAVFFLLLSAIRMTRGNGEKRRKKGKSNENRQNGNKWQQQQQGIGPTFSNSILYSLIFQ
jgi:hypothetical protein